MTTSTRRPLAATRLTTRPARWRATARRLRYLNPSSTSRTRPVNGAATSTPGGADGLGPADEGEAAGPAQRGAGPSQPAHRVVRIMLPIMDEGCASVSRCCGCPTRASSCSSVSPGAGKSTWAAPWFPAPAIVSSDDLRAVVGRHRHDLQATKDALEVLDLVVTKRLRRGTADRRRLDRPRTGGAGALPGLAGRGRRAVPRRRSSTRPSARRRARNRGRPEAVPSSVVTSQLRVVRRRRATPSATRASPPSTAPPTGRSSSCPSGSSTRPPPLAAKRRNR